jgi:hypothetical protein
MLLVASLTYFASIYTTQVILANKMTSLGENFRANLE